MLAKVAILLAVWPLGIGAHGGGLDSQGGHHDRKKGGYHFHRGPLKGKSYSTKASGAKALRGKALSGKSASKASLKSDAKAEGFTCGAKRTCGQMSTCAEARFYMDKCGLSRLDGDNDGTPCESLCR